MNTRHLGEKKPNIIFVHVDQLKWSALGINGSDQVQTPNLDRILRSAVRFDRSYCTAPICVPARTSWYTGLKPEQSGVTDNGRRIDMEEVKPVDLGTWLRDQAGYESYYMGKWHVAMATKDSGFEFLCDHNPIGEQGDTALARAAESFLLNRTEEKPFFLNVGLLNPHDICYWSWEQSPAKFRMAEEMKDRLPELPPNFDRERATAEEPDWSDLQWRFYAYSYFRFVEMVDEDLGRIYRAYLRSPQRDNTLFIFSSDHGQANGEHGHQTKAFPHEHSIRVPLAVIDPQADPHRDADHLVSGLDLAPTLCDYAGVPAMPRNHGRSLRPLVRGETPEWRQWLAATTPRMKHRMILKGDYKLIYERWNDSVSLFNLKTDPWEIEDLSKNPAHAPAFEEMEAFRKQYDAGQELAAAAKKDLARYQ
jgi:arylsulfatase A-like enzyme